MAAGRSAKVRALVLSAGLGQRLRPLTRQLAKPLLPVLGEPVLSRTLAELSRVQCELAVVNLHHLGDQIREALGQSVHGVPVSYAEEREILGTLGALGAAARALSEGDCALMINGDSLCRWPLRRLLKSHRRSGALVTLLAIERPPFPGRLAVSKTGALLQLRHERDVPEADVAHRGLVFGGAQVLSRQILDRVGGRIEPADVVSELYEPMLDAGEPIHVVTTRARWHDLGTPWRYLQGVIDWARRDVRRSWRSRQAEIESGCRLRAAVVERRARIGTGSRIESSVVLEGAHIGDGCRLRESIVAPGVSLPAGTGVERRLVTPLSSGRDPGARDSVVGQLVYTPIEVSDSVAGAVAGSPAAPPPCADRG